MNQEVFLIDTNALLTPHLMYYPFDLAPSFLEQLEEKLKDGSVVLLDMVRLRGLSAPSGQTCVQRLHSCRQ